MCQALRPKQQMPLTVSCSARLHTKQPDCTEDSNVLKSCGASLGRVPCPQQLMPPRICQCLFHMPGLSSIYGGSCFIFLRSSKLCTSAQGCDMDRQGNLTFLSA